MLNFFDDWEYTTNLGTIIQVLGRGRGRQKSPYKHNIRSNPWHIFDNFYRSSLCMGMGRNYEK
jgi:hypothetical protein